MPAFLISHTDQRGLNAAQAAVQAKTENKARKTFATLFPERVIGIVGQREGRAPTRRERRGR